VRGIGLVLLTVLALAACQRGPDSLPAAQRPLPTELPAAQRLQWRHLPLAGAPNFRDLGGYRSADGRSVRWGLVYRSDALDKLSDADQAYLRRLGLRRVVDFRAADEVEDAPDRLAPPLAGEVVHLPIAFAGLNVRQFTRRIMHGDTAGLHFDTLLVDANVAMVRQFSPVFRDWLHSLVADGATPQVFHCTAGKDRTGFAAAVLLLSLGVPRDTVMQDYLASNDYLRARNARSMRMMRLFSLFRADPDSVRPLMMVEPRYLDAAFAAMIQDYGSIDAYLQQALGVDAALREQLRQRFLEPAAS
jgi:protein-tyrosine phosphatase